MLSGGTRRRTLPNTRAKKMKILNIIFPQAEIEPIICLSVYSHTLCPCAMTGRTITKQQMNSLTQNKVMTTIKVLMKTELQM